MAVIFGFDYKKNQICKSLEYTTINEVLDLLEDIKLVFGVDLKSRLLGGVEW
ncbi:hypothetical protein ACOWKY_06680 [Helicobacter pylori]